ncbi:helix-turn-helix transcriptional regulator [Actinomadura graeca]|uniref:Helix-turn-helix transcriptional regulator n=1 Tax=Actinomadura graeca TaxID=2750812 RepID=A0ABX8QT45_9ACTN|nr:helix-turn-helix transcriptional regulator [Actinomadura graeca]QXJ21965.1 helix-turn-helix transcriptional regulator [Actinomadura graeca]
MGVSSLGDAFSVVMKRHGWSGAALARKLDVSQPWVSMVLAGKRDPGMAKAARLLRTVGWELELVPSEEDDPVRRRRFLASAASVALTPPATGRHPYRDASYVRLLADRLAYTEEQIGGAPLVREALRHVRLVAPAMLGTDTGLQSAASGLARHAALILHDTRDLDNAERVANLSLALAGKGRDTCAQANAYSTLSLIRTYGKPRFRAAEYVRRGLALHDLDDATRAALLVRLARSLAVLPGQERPVRRALEEAQALASRLNPADAAEVMANSGIALADCGLHALGAVDLRKAVAGVESQSPLLAGLYRARLTKSAIRAGDVGAMTEGVASVALVAPLLTSRRMDIHVRHILTGTRPWAAVPEVRKAREQLREVTR